MALDADRRAQLERARAEGLLRRCFDVDPAALEITAAPFGTTAHDGDRAWVISMSDDLAALGGVLVWLDRAQPASLDLVVDHHAGVHARRTTVLAPEIRVHRVEGDGIVAVDPEPVPPALPCPDDAAHLESILVEADLDVVCEDGILRGELAGLEVARILHGPDGPVLEAGVGRFDREAGALLHAGRDPRESVRATVTQVRPHRTPGAPSHAVNRLARERWLRHEVAAAPDAVDIDLPALVEPIPPRTSLLEQVPAALMGIDGDRSVLVVCSVGVDLGLVPAIADLLVVHSPDEVRVVLPERDRLPHLERLMARLPVPTGFRSIPVPWAD
ncbi:MAG: hypothetical protein R8F63_12005 [Acidimicrobiales bacterium]|nr:hypothetical protein [Acidimicrobiales bacterium]